MKVPLKRHLNLFSKLRRRLSAVKWSLLLMTTAMFLISMFLSCCPDLTISVNPAGPTVNNPPGNPPASVPGPELGLGAGSSTPPPLTLVQQVPTIPSPPLGLGDGGASPTAPGVDLQVGDGVSPIATRKPGNGKKLGKAKKPANGST